MLRSDYISGFGRKVLTSYPMPASSVKDGKWQPWNPTVEITLKEKRNPIPMYIKGGIVKLPRQNETFGFDFKIGDLVEPHGRGRQADLLLMCSSKSRGHILDFKKELSITAVQQDEGILVNKTDTGEFKSFYEAQEGGYEPQYYSIIDRTPSQMLRKAELAESEYLTFRSRIVRDEEGNIISSHYGKITSIGDYGIDEKNPEGAVLSFTYYFNPTGNDRNIEYDGKNNLLNSRDFRYPP